VLGRRPKASQFRPGKSGNPKGPPKGSRSVEAFLKEAIEQKVAVTENGKTRRISALEVMLRRLVNDAMRSDPRALKLLLPLIDRYSEPPQAVNAKNVTGTWTLQAALPDSVQSGHFVGRLQRPLVMLWTAPPPAHARHEYGCR
jgi:hypothetical protein